MKSKKIAFYYRTGNPKVNEAQIYKLWAQMISNCMASCTCDTDKDIFFDLNVSGLTAVSNRKGFSQLVNQIEHSNYDVIVTNNITTFSRDLCLFIGMLREIFEHGCDVYFVEQELYLRSIDDLIEYMNLVAQQEESV